MPQIIPCLWFNFNADEAIEFYKKVFSDFTVKSSSRYPAEGGPGPAGSLMVATVNFSGKDYMFLNGGPGFPFTEAISLSISAETQEEIDHYWNHLTADGGQESVCGWLKDKFGLSWQVSPSVLGKMMGDKDKAKAGRTMQAMMKMKKIVIADLQKAYDEA